MVNGFVLFAVGVILASGICKGRMRGRRGEEDGRFWLEYRASVCSGGVGYYEAKGWGVGILYGD